MLKSLEVVSSAKLNSKFSSCMYSVLCVNDSDNLPKAVVGGGGHFGFLIVSQIKVFTLIY